MVRRRITIRKGRARTAYQQRKNLAKQIAVLRKQTTPETKWKEAFDITASTEFCESDTSTPFDYSLLALSQGTSQHERIGNRIKIKSLYGRFTLQAPSGANGRLFRFVLYNPRDITDSLGTAVSGNPLTIHDQIDADRFTTLMDKSYYIGPCNGGGANLKQIVLGKKFKRMINQFYDSSSAVSATKNDLRLYIVSSQQVASSNKSYFQGYLKTYFIDP
jgi:hypothetical protein